MRDDLSTTALSTIDHDEELTTVLGGGNNSAGAAAGISVGKHGVNASASVSETKTDYRACLDALAKYGGKVGECKDALEKAK